jgi:hypothetical protein
MHDPRLIGTWRSDKQRTTREILARRDIPAGERRDTLVSMFGRLTLPRAAEQRDEVHEARDG